MAVPLQAVQTHGARATLRSSSPPRSDLWVIGIAVLLLVPLLLVVSTAIPLPGLIERGIGKLTPGGADQTASRARDRPQTPPPATAAVATSALETGDSVAVRTAADLATVALEAPGEAMTQGATTPSPGSARSKATRRTPPAVDREEETTAHSGDTPGTRGGRSGRGSGPGAGGSIGANGPIASAGLPPGGDVSVVSSGVSAAAIVSESGLTAESGASIPATGERVDMGTVLSVDASEGRAGISVSGGAPEQSAESTVDVGLAGGSSEVTVPGTTPLSPPPVVVGLP